MSVIVDTICPVDKTFSIALDTEGFARYLMALKGMRNRVEKVGETTIAPDSLKSSTDLSQANRFGFNNRLCKERRLSCEGQSP